MRMKFGAAVVAALLIAPQAAAKRRLPHDYAAWSRVARCESGGWRVLGWSYPDSLGMTRVNYERFGGVPMRPGHVGLAGRLREIRVADRFIRHYGIGIPDQEGCAAW